MFVLLLIIIFKLFYIFSYWERFFWIRFWSFKIFCWYFLISFFCIFGCSLGFGLVLIFVKVELMCWCILGEKNGVRIDLILFCWLNNLWRVLFLGSLVMLCFLDMFGIKVLFILRKWNIFCIMLYELNLKFL